MTVERERTETTATVDARRTTETADATEATDAFVEQILDAVAGAFTVDTMFVGHRLGYYDAIAEAGAVTAAELASATDTHDRYAREWLEQQTIAGILGVEDEDADGTARRYYLPAGREEALTDPDSPNYVAPLSSLVVGAVRPIDAILDAYRTGGGVSYEDYGEHFHEGQAAINRPSYLHSLGEEWIPAMSDVDERLRSDPPARVADVGCGYGWSCIGIAQTYPNVRVDGIDLDEGSVEAARENVAEAGLDDRVTVECRDAGDPNIEGEYDLVTAFECIHDLPDPVGVLRNVRRIVADDGAVLVADERVGESFTAEGNEVEWMMYGWSVLHCLPVGMTEQPSAATGTVMRTETLREYATEAGFSGLTVLPVEDYFFRFYRLEP
ncbi:Methyltransferase domain-containing protein [Halogranum amylolyticum]|uniref:Methyltransferase domain-containing protein n=1 Tax=Halogranum amylolyticum TaxID=660520 RepID=A0A1H8S3U2_9EURY|nr:class I SAM-dependent methyltransferase [Halogranum amylolyticum]SEO73262.1 Methyltransferase domain-containing protein [Halogranum amylolyticum]